MKIRSLFVVGHFMLLSALGVPAQADSHKHFNTVKQKLAEGKQVVGGTITTSDPTVYCAMAHAGFDFLWIEMQHSPLTYDQAARMIWACRDAPAIPFVRVPKATEGDIQKATDMGALGIVVPMVDSVQEAKDGVTYAKFPPLGKRSHGGGQYGRLWGPRYRELANDNIMVVMMIESPAGVDIVDQVAAIDGVDVVFAASGDIGSFTGWERDDPRYMALIEKIKVENPEGRQGARRTARMARSGRVHVLPRAIGRQPDPRRGQGSPQAGSGSHEGCRDRRRGQLAAERTASRRVLGLGLEDQQEQVEQRKVKHRGAQEFARLGAGTAVGQPDPES